MVTITKNSKGPLVSFLQLTLKDIGLYNDNIDGIFGDNTLKSVIQFQQNSNLSYDGIVGVNTWTALLPYMRVPTTISYTYDILSLNIMSLSSKYPFLKTGNIGESVMGKNIPYIKIGSGNIQVLYVAGTHANEWITCPILMKFVEDYLQTYASGEKILNRFAKELFDIATIYIVPMLNPDGIDLVTNNLNKNSKEYLNAMKISDNYPNIRFPDGWKANIQGIDLNLQFPARWEDARDVKFSQGYTTPAPRDFVGEYPLQAVEAMALYDFTTNNNFNIMLTYHSQGEVIYWKFLDYTPPNSLEIGQELSSLSGYSLELTPYSSSFAGFKDWFIQNYNRPGYTIEVGKGTNPLPISQFDKIYADNLPMLEAAPFLVQNT